jgi:hypothetical protein
LAGWSKVSLAPGGSAALSITVDPRLLSTFDEVGKSWRTAPGMYDVWLGESSVDTTLSVRVLLSAWRHSARWSADTAHDLNGSWLPSYCKVIAGEENARP